MSSNDSVQNIGKFIKYEEFGEQFTTLLLNIVSKRTFSEILALLEKGVHVKDVIGRMLIQRTECLSTRDRNGRPKPRERIFMRAIFLSRGFWSASGYLGSVRCLAIIRRFILWRVSDEKVLLVCWKCDSTFLCNSKILCSKRYISKTCSKKLWILMLELQTKMYWYM